MPSSLFRRLVNYEDPNSFASKLRTKRAQHLVALVEAVFAERGECNILDVGGTVSYWNIFSPEWMSSKGLRITLLNISASPLPDQKAEVFRSVCGDACDLSAFADHQFDIVHSNSVVEHVGLWPNMKRMAAEVRRVGRRYYVQTPNFWFPIEPHFFFPFLHWLPFPWRVWIAMRMSLGSWPRASSVDQAVAAQQAAILINYSMMRELFPDGKIHKERFFGISKSLIALSDRRVA